MKCDGDWRCELLESKCEVKVHTCDKCKWLSNEVIIEDDDYLD